MDALVGGQSCFGGGDLAAETKCSESGLTGQQEITKQSKAVLDN